MPTHNPRLNIVLDKTLMHSLSRLAKKDGISLSLKARDLIREALELEEDAYWSQKADKRAKTFSQTTSLTHQQVWRRTF